MKFAQMKHRRFAVVSAIAVGVLAGCAPVAEPMVVEIQNRDLGSLELVNDELVPNCGGSFGPCSLPLWEVYFAADPTVAALDVCTPVIELQTEVGLDAYMVDDTSAMASVPEAENLIAFCVERLETNLGDEGGTPYYQDVVLYEDGSEENLYKMTVISKREDGTYFVAFSLSKDQERIGFYEFE